jgi:glutamate--cysteine ligase
VLASPVLCVRRAGAWIVPEGITFADWVHGALPDPPTTADLDYHVSTLFPPVRPHGHLEIRYVDAQPGRRWALPTAVLVALLADPGVTDLAREACEPTQGRWTSAARHGLADRVLARAAATVFALASGQLPAIGAPDWVREDLADMIERQVLRGRSPADDAIPADGPGPADGPSPAEDPNPADPVLAGPAADVLSREPATPEGEPA